MPRILIPITFLACLLLVGGCFQESITPEKYKELSARADRVVAQHDTLEAVIRGILSYIPYQHCPPETVEVMPPGRWVKNDFLKHSCKQGGWVQFWIDEDIPPDSVFILKKE